ncbi:hypothetical protein BSL78_00194 [Apostichopus japonicus]|uniref:Peptidase A2 domain-containing protein n=1 Tax=Stichopus japonicus TaxID=307972 RepID=A0A2G8LRQ9_STIJA|nr:hypothetical protein BSL78_00194 [Apostichopus japonicus]
MTEAQPLPRKEPIQPNPISHLTPKVHRELTKLVGRRCLIECNLNTVRETVLWDTGSQVSIINEDWWKRNLAKTPLRGLGELMYPDLDLQMANGNPLPYLGWIEITVTLAPGQDFLVPFLVTPDNLSEPILGFNVIEEIINSTATNTQDAMETIFSQLKSNQVTKLIALIRNNDPEYVCPIKVGKQNVVVPKGQSINVRCQVHAGPIQKQMVTVFDSRAGRTLATGIECA